MGTNLEKYRADLKRLRDEAEEMKKELDVLVIERDEEPGISAEKMATVKAKFAGAFENPTSAGSQKLALCLRS